MEPRSNTPTTVTLTLGIECPVKFRLDKWSKQMIDRLFPNDNYHLKNKVHPCVTSRDHQGERRDFYLRRIIVDLALREQGIVLPKGYSIETKDRDPSNLTLRNLRIKTTKERLAAGQTPRRNGCGSCVS